MILKFLLYLIIFLVIKKIIISILTLIFYKEIKKDENIL